MIGQNPSYNTDQHFSTIPAGESLTPTVAAIGELELTGNLIPQSWYHQIKLPSDHPDLVGITLLGEIVYQYRPGVVRDEETGEPLHTFKRFARDKFCAPIAYFEKKFGLTKDQVRQALKRLEEGGYIRREYRDILVAGRWVRGMTFIEPVPERIRAITPPPRLDARPAPGAVQRPKAAAVRQRSAPRGEGSAPEGAVSTPGGAVQIPLYRDTIEIPERTTTPPTPPSDTKADSGSWSCTQQATDQTPQFNPTEPTNTPAETVPAPNPASSTATEEEGPPTAEPTPPRPAPLSESRVTQQDTPPAAATTSSSPTAPPLRFDFHLAALDVSQQAELRRRLARLPSPLAQAVLDEYNSAVGRKVEFRNKWGWFEFLIRAALDGRFIPTSDLAERRAAQAQADATPIPNPAASPPPRQPSTVWKQQRSAVKALFAPDEGAVNLSPLRAVEDGQALWLEAPNRYVADWVRTHLPQIETVLKPYTVLPIRVCIG